MKIVFFIRSLGCGGAERQLVRLATHLASRHDVSILTFYDANDFFQEEVERAHIPLITLGKRGRWDLLSFVRRFLAVVNGLEPDVIYAYMNTAGIVALAARATRAAPRVVWGIRSSNMELRKYGAVHGLLRRLEAWLSPLAAAAISNSEAGRAQALADGFRQDLLVIHNGIDTSKFVRDEAAGRALREQCRIPASAPVIGIVARLDPMKGYETFLRAAALCLERHDTPYFLAAGDGSDAYTATLKALAEDLGISDRIRWIGRCGDVIPVYSAMDVYTSSSSFGEGFSNAVGEAMACGLPCVVTDVGDSRLIVGDTGLTVPPDAPQDLCAAWTSLLTARRDELRARGIAARDRIVAEYSELRMVDRTEAALGALAQ